MPSWITLTYISILIDGFTPLMLASFHGGGIAMGIEEADSCSGSDGYDGSAAIITDLINNGAGIHAQTDRTGKILLLNLNF